jgi:HCO3- transporter family
MCYDDSLIINKKDRNLKKGSGYHLDLFLIGLLSIVCGFLGVPIMCSATVRSVTHVSALSVFSTTHAPGEKPKLLGVREQRATSLAVHVMIGMSTDSFCSRFLCHDCSQKGFLNCFQPSFSNVLFGRASCAIRRVSV